MAVKKTTRRRMVPNSLKKDGGLTHLTITLSKNQLDEIYQRACKEDAESVSSYVRKTMFSNTND